MKINLLLLAFIFTNCGTLESVDNRNIWSWHPGKGVLTAVDNLSRPDPDESTWLVPLRVADVPASVCGDVLATTFVGMMFVGLSPLIIYDGILYLVE